MHLNLSRANRSYSTKSKTFFSTLANLTHPMPVSTQNLTTCVVQIPHASKDKNAYQGVLKIKCEDTKPCQQGIKMHIKMY